MNMFRFPTKLSLVLVLAGSATALGGVFYAGKIFLAPDPSWLRVGLGLAVAVAGLVVLAMGELIGVVFAIEENTRRATELLDAMATTARHDHDRPHPV